MDQEFGFDHALTVGWDDPVEYNERMSLLFAGFFSTGAGAKRSTPPNGSVGPLAATGAAAGEPPKDEKSPNPEDPLEVVVGAGAPKSPIRSITGCWAWAPLAGAAVVAAERAGAERWAGGGED